MRIEPLPTILAARLTCAAPEGVTLRLLASPLPSEQPPGGPLETSADRLSFEIPLGRLSGRRPLLLEFAVRIPPGRGGAGSFALTGSRIDGRRVGEAIGVSMGMAPSSGVERWGAIEFPAVRGEEAAR